MANPVIIGILITPNPPLPGGPVAVRIAADDPDLTVQESFDAQIKNLITGVISKGLLTSAPEVLTYALTSPDIQLTQNSVDPSLFSGIAPSTPGPKNLTFDALVTDSEGNPVAQQVVSQDINYPPTTPPTDPPTGKVLKWEKISDFDKNGNLAQFVATANNDVNGSKDTYVTDAPPESGFPGKVCEIDYTSFGAKDTNRSFSYKPNGNAGDERPNFGDVVETELLFTIPQPVGETFNAARKVTYYQPRLNGPNHLVYATGAPTTSHPTTANIGFTLSNRFPPTPEHPNGKLQRLNIMFEFGKPQRFRARCQLNSAPGVYDGYIELWCEDPNDPANGRYGILKDVEVMSELNFPWIDLRHGQQVNDNDARPYSEKRWFKFARVALYR